MGSCGGKSQSSNRRSPTDCCKLLRKKANQSVALDCGQILLELLGACWWWVKMYDRRFQVFACWGISRVWILRLKRGYKELPIFANHAIETSQVFRASNSNQDIQSLNSQYGWLVESTRTANKEMHSTKSATTIISHHVWNGHKYATHMLGNGLLARDMLSLI